MTKAKKERQKIYKTFTSSLKSHIAADCDKDKMCQRPITR